MPDLAGLPARPPVELLFASSALVLKVHFSSPPLPFPSLSLQKHRKQVADLKQQLAEARAAAGAANVSTATASLQASAPPQSSVQEPAAQREAALRQRVAQLKAALAEAQAAAAAGASNTPAELRAAVQQAVALQQRVTELEAVVAAANATTGAAAGGTHTAAQQQTLVKLATQLGQAQAQAAHAAAAAKEAAADKARLQAEADVAARAVGKMEDRVERLQGDADVSWEHQRGLAGWCTHLHHARPWHLGQNWGEDRAPVGGRGQGARRDCTCMHADGQAVHSRWCRGSSRRPMWMRPAQHGRLWTQPCCTLTSACPARRCCPQPAAEARDRMQRECEALRAELAGQQVRNRLDPAHVASQWRMHGLFGLRASGIDRCAANQLPGTRSPQRDAALIAGSSSTGRTAYLSHVACS